MFKCCANGNKNMITANIAFVKKNIAVKKNSVFFEKFFIEYKTSLNGCEKLAVFALFSFIKSIGSANIKNNNGAAVKTDSTAVLVSQPYAWKRSPATSNDIIVPMYPIATPIPDIFPNSFFPA